MGRLLELGVRKAQLQLCAADLARASRAPRPFARRAFGRLIGEVFSTRAEHVQVHGVAARERMQQVEIQRRHAREAKQMDALGQPRDGLVASSQSLAAQSGTRSEMPWPVFRDERAQQLGLKV